MTIQHIVLVPEEFTDLAEGEDLIAVCGEPQLGTHETDDPYCNRCVKLYLSTQDLRITLGDNALEVLQVLIKTIETGRAKHEQINGRLENYLAEIHMHQNHEILENLL